jgi:hypothetical protein
MRPEQVIDMQTDLVARMQPGRGLRRTVAEQAIVDMGAKGGTQRLGESIASGVLAQVQAAYAYRVTAEMSMLVQHAADSLSSEDRVDVGLAPTGCGFVRFERPLPVHDVRGEVLKANWMTWGPATYRATSAFGQEVEKAAVMMTLWNDLDDPDEAAEQLFRDLGERKVRGAVGRWGMIGYVMMVDGMSMGPPTADPDAETQARIIAEGDTPTSFTNGRRYAHALWLLLQQTVTVSTQEHVAARSLRAAQRMIELRRHVGMERGHGESVVEWSHRWLVRGHWRWQAYGPGRTERRRIWIAPFVKGPEDKPFAVTDRVYDLRR